MATTQTVITPKGALEDPLAYLPYTGITEYAKGKVIYGKHRPSTAIHLVTSGKVQVGRLLEDGKHVVVDIYQPEEMFGESAFLGGANRFEQAKALEPTSVMTWSAEEVGQIILKRPELALAILQILTRRNMELADRIESFSVDSTAQRLARCLIRLSERMGTPDDPGSVRLDPFTHELLSQYIGTSREIVTLYMNQFRRQGYLQYSRRGIMVRLETLKAWMQQN